MNRPVKGIVMDRKDVYADSGAAKVLLAISNFWYHYKVYILIGSCFVAFAVFCIVQCASRPALDVNVMVAGPFTLPPAERGMLDKSLSELLGEDLTGDGKITVGLAIYDVRPVGINVDEGYSADAQTQQIVRQQMDIDIQTYNSLIYFISRELYDELRRDGFIEHLAYALGVELSSKVSSDGYGIVISDLDAYGWFEGLCDLPPDTVLALRAKRPDAVNVKDIDDKYDRNCLFLKRIVEFESPKE